MKNKIIRIINRSYFRKAICLLIVAVMFINILPCGIICDYLKETELFGLTASAVDPASPPTGYAYAHDANNAITLKITDFYGYCKSYQTYYTYHKNDKITILTSTGNTRYFERDFSGLGTDSDPFCGELTIESGQTLVLNLDAPLFNSVADTVKLNGDVRISRFYGNKILSGVTINDNTPLIAKKVVAGTGVKATWNISVVKPSATDDNNEGTLKQFGGMIGTIGTGSDTPNLTLNVTMNQETGDANAVALKSNTNLGLACGLINTGATLSFSVNNSSGSALRQIDDITTSSGNVGGLVGEMRSGSTFNYNGSLNNIQSDGKNIKTSNGHAGCLVGKISEATVALSSANKPYNIKQHMVGTKGVGGIYGYYKPKSDEITIDLNTYSIDGTYVQENGTGEGKAGNIGGLFGEFECNHSFTFSPATITTTIKSNHASIEGATYGGLIGLYKTNSLNNVLTIGALTVETKNPGKTSSYGGAIGKVDETTASYLKFNSFTVDKSYNAGNLTYGGLIGTAEKSFVDAYNVTIKTDGTFNGGGLVGNLGNGVLRMTGTTDLSSAKSASATKDVHLYGQIVGYRDNGLVFAESGWILKRSEAVQADDIGAWGEVLRFNGKATSGTSTNEQFGGNTVITVNESAHTVTIGAPVAAMSTVADFAKNALNMQLNSGSIITIGGSVSNSLSLGAAIDLRGTGLTGLTRDNYSNGDTADKYKYSGNFNSAGNKLTLAIGEPYGNRGETNLSSVTVDSNRTNGDGRIYNHKYNGLFGILNGSTVGDINAASKSVIDGKISVSPFANSVYVGSVAAIAKTSIKVSNVDIQTEFYYGGDQNVYLGRLVGEVSETTENTDSTKAVDIQKCDLKGKVSGNNASDGTAIGGVLGKIYHTTNAKQNWYLKTISTTGTIENTAARTEQIMGGLIAKIHGYSTSSDFKKRELTLDGVTTSSLEIKAASATSMGGLLGYEWLNTNATLTSVSVNTGSKVTATGAVSDMAGLVYCATGKWTVTDLDINDITIAASSPRSFGMIVNKGWYSESSNYKTDESSSAIYMLLPSTTCYTITSATQTLLSSASVYDELVAYSAYYSDDGSTRSGTDASGDEYILKNGAGVISIKTSETNGLNMNGTTLSNSYQAKTSLGAKPNPWSRYYYNLDSVTSSTVASLTTPQMKLMSWGLHQYAHRSINSEFAAADNTFAESSEYDLKGYSWYPVDVDSGVTVKGTIILYNKEFELSEAQNGGTHSSIKSSLVTQYNSADTTTQHFLLHASLFRNVSSGITVSAKKAALQGNIGMTDKYCGALICGTVAGNDDMHKSKIDIDDLTLQGVYIHNIANVTGNSKTYAPLLINKITQYANLTAKNIQTGTTANKTYTTSAFVPYIKNDGTYPKAGSSLIGAVGSSDAKGINLNFTLIKLDGRSDGYSNSALDTAYGTSSSIFTKATLLDKFEFESGSTGTYTYTWDDDWSSGRKVTYGKEVGYTTQGEYPDMERIYSGEPEDATARYTNPDSNSDTSGTSVASVFTGNFLPYVSAGYEGRKHQLEVNHRTTLAEGCGTYNDPYMISSSSDLENFAKILNGSYGDTKVTLPTSAERTAYWCDDKTNKTNHKIYNYDGTNFVNGSDSISTTDVRTYLAGAYYKLKNDIVLENYSGLSNTNFSAITDEYAVFRGVIDGGGYTITNKSSVPLIVNSYGSVVKNLTISVESTADISLLQNNNSDVYPVCKSYGGVIGTVLGGDNILDEVKVTYASMTNNISLTGTNAQLIPVGGYIGVVVNGAVIFKYPTTAAAAIPQGLNTLPSGKLNDGTNSIDVSAADWLYVNPIIGRVLNGYAVTESTSYQTSESSVTMKNGTKNYSIADINKNETNKLSTSAFTAVSGASSMYSTDVTIPNAQALFVMSLLTQSSTTVSVPSTGAISLGESDSYDTSTTYKKTRCAVYGNVGTNNTNDNKPADYTTALADQNRTNKPFIVANYTDTTNYCVLALTHAKTVCNFVISNAGSWTLPDGFRGIGSIGFKRSDLTNRIISLHKFNGSGLSLTLNMSLRHYESGFENYLPVNTNKGGFGLFDTLRHNRSDQGAKADDYKIHNFSITGTIDYYVFKHSESDGKMTYTKTNVENNAYLNTGGIAGYAGFAGSDSITVESIGVGGLTVNGFETAGGFFGNLQLANNETNHQVSISNINAQTSFSVTSKRYSGGIIGYFEQGNLNINDVTIQSPMVLSDFKGESNTDFANGTGGIIGYAKNSSNNKPIKLKSVKMGNLSSTINNRIGFREGNTFSSSTEDTVAAGGLIGISDTSGKKGSSYTLIIEDCDINRISVYGHRIGGLIGTDGLNNAATNSEIIVYNCSVKSPPSGSNRCTLYGLTKGSQHRACGGLIGGVKNKSVTIDTCTVEGYVLQGFNDTGTVCAWVDGGKLTFRNIKIKDILLKSNYSGSLTGWLSADLFGYNILCDNIQFQDKDGNGTEKTDNGYIIAKIKKKVKIVGFSRQNSVAASGCFVPIKLAGRGSGALQIDNGTDRYVIFADYLNNASSTNATFSNVNTGATNVKDYNGNAVTDNFPYVTSSPKMYIGTDQFLTGDAVSSAVYTGSALEQIINDKTNSVAGNYSSAPAVNNDLLQTLKDHMSTSQTEFGRNDINDFPLLIVNDTNVSNVTSYINYYLQNLTNTSMDFKVNLENVFEITLHKCTLQDNGKFLVGAAGTGSLLDYETGFAMDASKIDNEDLSTPQFTLMDVRFFDPGSTSCVAYHLYVPIFVKKLIQFRFSSKLVSGTNYYPAAYTHTNAANTMFENLGNPVTMKLTYTYERTASDWASAINAGENVYSQSNFYKSLQLSMSNNGWAPNSRLALVDASNDKHYYLNPTITGQSYEIDFADFQDEDGNAYAPVNLNTFLDVTCSESGDGTLIRTNNAAQATVIDTDGNMYKPKGNDTTSQCYTATVASTIRPEEYYLSFFTKKNDSNSVFYHYEINSSESFEKKNSNNANWIPNEIVSRVYNDTVHLIIGKLYIIDSDNNSMYLNVASNTGNAEITQTNRVLTVTMRSSISLTPDAIAANIPTNLSNNPNSTIFQTFLMNYEMRDANDEIKIGVADTAISQVGINSYKLYPGTAHGEGVTFVDLSSQSQALITGNYIELRNNKNLNQYLRDSTNSYSAIIETEYYVEYLPNSIDKQFPERIDAANTNTGALVRGFSNVSSVAESGAYSSSSSQKNDTTRYYIQNLATAKLSYTADKTLTSPDGEYSSLGINPFDEGTNTSNKGSISTTAIYNYDDLSDTGDFVEFSLSLTCKTSGYSDSSRLVLSDYLQNITITANDQILYGTNAITDAEKLTSSLNVAGTILTIRAHKDLVRLSDDASKIQISYDVLTGETNGFGTTKAYSNYKVTLTADIFEALSGGSANTQASAFDHIIYTNSRLQYKML